MLPEPAPEIFRGLVGRVVDTFIAHTEASPIAIAAQFIVGFGNAAGRAPHFAVGETIHRLNENLLIVGQSSKARKGDSFNNAFRALIEADQDWGRNITSGLSSGEGLIHAVRDPVSKEAKGEVVLTDQGVPDKRLMVIETEFAGALKQSARDGNTLSNTVRDAWDGKTVLRTLTKTSPTRATDAHVSLIGHTTPDDLLTYLTSTDVANGFANRFLMVSTARSKLLANPGRADADAVAMLADQVLRALLHARRAGEIQRTTAANEYWEHVYPTLSADKPGLLGSLLARAEAHVVRLSALYALICSADSIDVPHLESALAFWDYCESSVISIFLNRTGNEAADRILSELPPGGTLTLSQIREDIFSGHISAGKLTEALKLLEEVGEVVLGREETGGRPRVNVTRVSKTAREEKPDKRGKGLGVAA